MSDTRMEVVGSIEQPAQVRMSLTITMPLADWETHLEHLRSSEGATRFPTWALIDEVRKRVRALRAKVEGDPAP